LVLNSISCVESTKDLPSSDLTKIEIYLPKKRIPTSIGSSIPEKDRDKVLAVSRVDSSKLLFVRMDTLNNRLIFAGPFISSESDLPEKPFVSDEEIIGYNFETNTLRLTKEGALKLYNLEPNFRLSTQFILTSDRQPILNGYFFNVLSSSWVDTYFIEYIHQVESVDLKKIETDFNLRYNSSDEYEFNVSSPNMKADSLFYNVFRHRSY